MLTASDLPINDGESINLVYPIITGSFMDRREQYKNRE